LGAERRPPPAQKRQAKCAQAPISLGPNVVVSLGHHDRSVIRDLSRQLRPASSDRQGRVDDRALHATAG